MHAKHPTKGGAAVCGGGEMGELVRSLEWTNTSLGPIDQWSPAMLGAVNTCLNSRFPMLILWGPRYVMLYNDSYRDILGSRHPSALGRPYAEVWPEIWHEIEPMFAAALERGESYWQQRRLHVLERDDFCEEAYFTYSTSPIYDGSSVVGVLGVVSEATQEVLGMRRMELLRRLAHRTNGADSVEHACAMAADLLNSSPSDVPFSLVYRVDNAEGSARLVGPSRVDALDAVVSNHISVDDAASRWPIEQVLAGEEARCIELDPPVEADAGADIDPRPIASQALVMSLPHAPAGTAQFVLVAGINDHLRWDDAYRDFLELVASQLSTAIAQAHERAHLRDRERRKDEFLAMLGHELRNPLAPIVTGLEILELKCPDGTVRRPLEAMNRQVQSLVRIVDDLLDVSRITRGKIELRPERLNLAEAVRAALAAAEPHVARYDHRVEVCIDDAPLMIDADPVRIEQILVNLLTNAAKYTDPGGTIWVEAARDGEHARVVVRDNGHGMNPATLDEVFDLFTQAHQGLAREKGGLGIGLTVVRQLVELHGGTICAASDGPGHGSQFTVLLPQAE